MDGKGNNSCCCFMGMNVFDILGAYISKKDNDIGWEMPNELHIFWKCSYFAKDDSHEPGPHQN